MPYLFNEIISILIQLIYTCLALVAIMHIYLIFTIRPRFEKLFKNISPVMSYESLRWGSKAGRFNDYLWLINNYDFHKKYNTLWYRRYSGYNFRDHISTFEFFIVKVSNFIGVVGLSCLSIGISIKLFFNEEKQSDLLHQSLLWLFLNILISSILVIILYFYLKKRLMPRVKKLMACNLNSQLSTAIFFTSYLRLLANYTSEQRRNTPLYRLLQSYNFLSHISRSERWLIKLVWWAGIIFLLSIIIILLLIFIRICTLK